MTTVTISVHCSLIQSYNALNPNIYIHPTVTQERKMNAILFQLMRARVLPIWPYTFEELSMNVPLLYWKMYNLEIPHWSIVSFVNYPTLAHLKQATANPVCSLVNSPRM